MQTFFQVDLPFQGLESYPLLNNISPGKSIAPAFKMQVKFEGTNVIEGLKELSEKGYSTVPMKPHLAKLAKTGRNMFYIKPREVS